MTESESSAKADKLIELLITHQPALFGTTHVLSNKGDPENVAQALAALRQQLIANLIQQPA